jgi:hypothetical protein
VTFMGHDLSVHKNYYRLPESTLQVAKISKILLLMEKGKVDKLMDVSSSDEDVQKDSSDESDTESLYVPPSNESSSSSGDNGMVDVN